MDLKQSLRWWASAGAAVLFCIGSGLIFGLGFELLSAIRGETTKGDVIRREGNRVTYRFSFHNKTYEHKDHVDPDTATPMPGDKVAVRAWHNRRHDVVSYLETSHGMLVKRDSLLVVVGIAAICVSYLVFRPLERGQEAKDKDSIAVCTNARADRLDEDAAVDAAWELKMALHKANALEARGEFAEAIKQFELVARMEGEGHPSAAKAHERVRELSAKVQGMRPEQSATVDPPPSL